MASLITYKLNEDGTIPDYIIDGGYYPNDSVLIGVSSNNNSGFQSKEELIVYLASYTQSWLEPGLYPIDGYLPFNIIKASDYLWDKISN